MREAVTRGRGRPSLGPGHRRTTVFLTEDQIDRLKEAGRGNASAGLRALVEDRDHLAAALTRACADLRGYSPEAGGATAEELANDYLAIARVEAAAREATGGRS